MRGLNERIALTYERVIARIEAAYSLAPVEVDTQLHRLHAEDHGYHDYVTDRTRDMPLMYVDDFVLAEGWRYGQLSAADDEEAEALALMTARAAWYAEGKSPGLAEYISMKDRCHAALTPACDIDATDIPY